MVAWVIIIIALAVFHIFAFLFSFPETYIYIGTILLLVGALGMVYRAHIQAYNKRMTERRENLEERLEERRKRGNKRFSG